jgi:aminodeoxyfutalosine deaminase
VNNDFEHQIRQLPKAELHVHLEGSIGIRTLNRLRERRGKGPLQKSPYVFNNFESFNAVFLFISEYLKDEEDFHIMAADFVAGQAAQNIRYTEASFMPLFHVFQGVQAEALFHGIESGLAEGEKQQGTVVRLICSIPRMAGPDAGEQTLDLILEHRTERIVGIDLAGTEKEKDMAPFGKTFRRAGELGLRRVAHAGELASPKQIARALDILGAERIGHGISLVQDTKLAERVAKANIPLEISPTSNVRLKTVSSLKAHPVRQLFEMGVPIVINTDDPAFFNTTLSRELGILRDHFQFGENEIRGLIDNAFTYSFMKADEKARRGDCGKCW